MKVTFVPTFTVRFEGLKAKFLMSTVVEPPPAPPAPPLVELPEPGNVVGDAFPPDEEQPAATAAEMAPRRARVARARITCFVFMPVSTCHRPQRIAGGR